MSYGYKGETLKELTKSVGEKALGFVQYAGGLFTLLCQTLLAIAMPPFRAQQTFEQMVKIGVDSLPIATLTSFFPA